MRLKRLLHTIGCIARGGYGQTVTSRHDVVAMQDKRKASPAHLRPCGLVVASRAVSHFGNDVLDDAFSPARIVIDLRSC